MSDSVNDLYQDRIVHHYRNPHRQQKISESECTAEGFNTICGDRVRLQIQTRQDRVLIQHETVGCAVCIASASIMAQHLHQQNKETALAVIESVLSYLGKDEALPEPLTHTDIPALVAVKPFPMRHKCATLPWTVLQDALQKISISND